MKRRTTLTQPTRRTRPGIAAVASHWVGVGMARSGGGVDLVEAVIAVIDGALGGVS